MTLYEFLLMKSEQALKLSIDIEDENLKKFYQNARKGYLAKMGKISLVEAEGIVNEYGRRIG